jgi:hypothetical protein
LPHYHCTGACLWYAEIKIKSRRSDLPVGMCAKRSTHECIKLGSRGEALAARRAGTT